MNKNLKIGLIITLVLLVITTITIYFVFFIFNTDNSIKDNNPSDNPSDSVLENKEKEEEKDLNQDEILIKSKAIDKIIETLGANCNPYVNHPQYKSVYTICQLENGLRFRIDDTSKIAAVEIKRLEDAIGFTCYDLITNKNPGSVINSIKVDDIIISSYLLNNSLFDLKNFNDYRLELSTEDKPASLINYCTDRTPTDRQTASIELSESSNFKPLIEKLKLVCDTQITRQQKSNVHFISCRHNNTGLKLVDYTNATQVANDHLINSAQNEGCSEEEKSLSLAFNERQLYITNPNLEIDISKVLKELISESDDEAELVALCH